MNTVRFKFQSEICDLKSEINMLDLKRWVRAEFISLAWDEVAFEPTSPCLMHGLEERTPEQLKGEGQ